MIAVLLWFATIRDAGLCNARYAIYGQTVRFHDGNVKELVKGEDRMFIEGGILNILYGDLTGDGKDEAVVLIGYRLGGTGFFTFANVYGIVNGELTMLGRINGGDRAYGDFHDLAIENGRLRVVRKWTTKCMGCTEGYETTIWKWNGSKLALQKKTKVTVEEKDIQPDLHATNPCAHQ